MVPFFILLTIIFGISLFLSTLIFKTNKNRWLDVLIALIVTGLLGWLLYISFYSKYFAKPSMKAQSQKLVAGISKVVTPSLEAIKDTYDNLIKTNKETLTKTNNILEEVKKNTETLQNETIPKTLEAVNTIQTLPSTINKTVTNYKETYNNMVNTVTENFQQIASNISKTTLPKTNALPSPKITLPEIIKDTLDNLFTKPTTNTTLPVKNTTTTRTFKVSINPKLNLKLTDNTSPWSTQNLLANVYNLDPLRKGQLAFMGVVLSGLVITYIIVRLKH